MPGYCGLCNHHYDCHYTVHDSECAGEEENNDKFLLPEEKAQRDMDEQGIPQDEKEQLWRDNAGNWR